jgi:hypothetical protein
MHASQVERILGPPSAIWESINKDEIDEYYYFEGLFFLRENMCIEFDRETKLVVGKSRTSNISGKVF